MGDRREMLIPQSLHLAVVLAMNNFLSGSCSHSGLQIAEAASPGSC